DYSYNLFKPDICRKAEREDGDEIAEIGEFDRGMRISSTMDGEKLYIVRENYKIGRLSSEKMNNMNRVKKILGEHILADGYNFVMDYEKSHGSWIVDEVTGKEY